MGSGYDLDSMVSAFQESQAFENSIGIHHLFDHPSKGDVVRLADKVQGFMKPAHARDRIEAWIDHARSQAACRENSDKVCSRFSIPQVNGLGLGKKPATRSTALTFKTILSSVT